MTTNRDPVIIFDLDGTLLRVNSFRPWFLYLVMGRYPHLTLFRRLLLSCRAAGVMAQRKLLFCDHFSAKRKLQKLWSLSVVSDKNNETRKRLTAQLAETVRPCFNAILQDVRERRIDTVLATAAADEYARALGIELGFCHILTSPPVSAASNAKENVGANKAANVKAFLQTQGWEGRKRILLTDHHEDLPLMLLCDHVLWFGPDDRMKAVQDKAPGVVFTACRAMSEQQLGLILSQPLEA